ncbi:MAG TPA: hypothetical protein VEK08_21180 [Planctomycetota bacterium]|nr:hypothetical protein [Planctomycetota bacterium]
MRYVIYSPSSVATLSPAEWRLSLSLARLYGWRGSCHNYLRSGSSISPRQARAMAAALHDALLDIPKEPTRAGKRVVNILEFWAGLERRTRLLNVIVLALEGRLLVRRLSGISI